jgi:hypothetical protein
MNALGPSFNLQLATSLLQEPSMLPYLFRQLPTTKSIESFTLEDITTLNVDLMILGSTKLRLESGTESVTRRITQKILSQRWEPRLLELTPQLSSTKAKFTSLEVMED